MEKDRFDPLEEEFDLPAIFVNGCDSEGWEFNEPTRSICVCNLIAAFVVQNFAHGNIDRHSSMVDTSTA